MELIRKINAIYKRRSIRSFTNDKIDRKLLYEIIRAGTFAPSSGNMQPWEFVIIEDVVQRKNIAKNTFSGYYSSNAPFQRWLTTAPIIIVICANKKRTASRYAELSDIWVYIDVANAVQNMILTATENHLGTCWIGGIKKDQVAKSLHLPSYVEPIGLLPIGNAAESVMSKNKMKPEWVTHKAKYNKPYFK